ncbi:fimbrial protein [Pseudomonas sp. CCM 7893]|uniref:Fimbrial protein n=1 Tax=Pseudomonas spelaei TaxID=1055469 RepID=A0A6I3VZ47_9PSED|nr:fimbrial protein [Pseudomonas spelaei]MUF03660.1 fimbrial protein [Pseudomonas spelaei]
MINSHAINCGFSNGMGGTWVEVTPLTSSTPVGSILWQRAVGLNANYVYGPASGNTHHELVSAGYWTGGTPLPEGIAPTNVSGIGFKIAVSSSDGVLRPITQSPLPVAFEKESIQYDSSAGQNQRSSLATNYIQYLILTVPPSQLPGGKLIVERVDGSAQLMLYAVDLVQGEARLGGGITVPVTNIPNGICRTPYPLMGPAIINVGGGGPITLPNTCQVEAYKTLPVELGRFAINTFPEVGSTSTPTPFSIELSQCAVNARPAITFRDKYAKSTDSTILGIDPVQNAAKGFGIIVINGLTEQRIRYDFTSYEMQRVGDRARMPLRASYIRTGGVGELKAGKANGAVEFTFTFP